MDAFGNWLIILGLIILGVLAGLWAIWKLFGVVLNVVLSGQDKKLRESPLCQAVQAVADGGGYNDGSPLAKARAEAAFLDLAEESPLELDATRSRLTAFAKTFAEGSPSKYPMMVDAVYAVSLFVDETDLAAWKASDDGYVTDLMGHFTALFPGWTKDHQTGSPRQIRIEMARMAMMMILLADKSELLGSNHPS